MSASPFDPNAKPHRPDYSELNAPKAPPTALEQARAFRAEHENARNERITGHETAAKELDEEKAFALERQVVDRAVAVGTIKDAFHERQYMGHAISHGGTETFAKYEREVTADEINKQMPKEWRDAERQAALAARIEAQKRGVRSATQTWQDGPTRPAIPPLPGKAPEAQAEREKNQTPAEPAQAAPKIEGRAEDLAKSRNADAERQARIVAQKQTPNSQAQTAPQIEGQAQDQGRAQSRDADAERQARIAAQKRGEPASQEKQDMPPPVPKPHIRR